MVIAVTTKDVRSAWKGLVSHIFGTGTIHPKHVQAVYLPAWIVDAEVEANAWLGDSSQVRSLLLGTDSTDIELVARN